MAQVLVDDVAVLMLTRHRLRHKADFYKQLRQDSGQQDNHTKVEIERLQDCIFANHDELFPDSPKPLVWAATQRISELNPETPCQNDGKKAYQPA